MLWNPPQPQPKPVLRLTAEQMGLEYWDREPFRFDGAFVERGYTIVGNLPVPIVAVFEHENDIRGSDEEISKLARMRRPLKVGITYSNLWEPTTSPAKLAECQERIFGWANSCFETLNRHTTEDEKAEYVYLLGVDGPIYVLTWFVFSFTAKNGPSSGIWRKI